MNPDYTPKARSAWHTLQVKISRGKKWAWINSFKPAEPHSWQDSCCYYLFVLYACASIQNCRKLHHGNYLEHLEHAGVGCFNAADVEMFAVLFSQSVHQLGIWPDVTVCRRHWYNWRASSQALWHCRWVHGLDKPWRMVVNVVNHYRHRCTRYEWQMHNRNVFSNSN